MIRKVSFGSSPRASAQAQSVQPVQKLIQKVPQIVVAPTMADASIYGRCGGSGRGNQAEAA